MEIVFKKVNWICVVQDLYKMQAHERHNENSYLIILGHILIRFLILGP
jgi:hypothetical protein